jgi:hypothetical protein
MHRGLGSWALSGDGWYSGICCGAQAHPRLPVSLSSDTGRQIRAERYAVWLNVTLVGVRP